MAESTTAYLGLGGNLGDRDRSIRCALDGLNRHPGIEVTRVSALRETQPLGPSSQPNYLNGVAEIETTLEPGDLLGVLKATEDALGRQRDGKWTSRTIDLDLLLFGREVIHTADLVVPHPQMHLRSFVLDGLCQLRGDLTHPVLREPVRDLARRLNGCDFALDPHAPQLVSVAGIIGVGKTTVAKKLAEALRARVLFEPYDTNPFLQDVYAGKRELALDSQLFFLVNRAGQLGRDALPAGKTCVTDYVFDKELIYARRLLSREQLKLYESFYGPFAERVARPVVVLYLEDSPQACLERIHCRNRPYEQRITGQFLEGLDTDYARLFADWTTCPVIRVPASTLTGYREAVVEHLARQVKAYVVAQTLPDKVVSQER